MGDHVLGIEIELVDDDEDVPQPAQVRQQQDDLADIQRQANELVREVEALRLIQRGQAAQQGENAGLGEVNGAANIQQLRAVVGDGPAAPAEAGPAANAQAPRNANPAPAAPAARPQPNGWEFRQNVSIFAVARTVVATLLFPAASSVVGNLLELTLPKTWVTPPSVPLSTGGFLTGLSTLWSGKKANVAAGTWKKGLLQEKWGRTIVGGMIVVGIKDAVGLYVLWRRAKIEGQRKVLDHGAGDGIRRRREVPGARWADEMEARRVVHAQAERERRERERQEAGV